MILVEASAVCLAHRRSTIPVELALGNFALSIRALMADGRRATHSLEEAQSASGVSRLFAYIMSRCSKRIGSSAASICPSRLSKAARVLASILHCAGGSGPNIAVKVAL